MSTRPLSVGVDDALQSVSQSNVMCDDMTVHVHVQRWHEKAAALRCEQQLRTAQAQNYLHHIQLQVLSHSPSPTPQLALCRPVCLSYY